MYEVACPHYSERGGANIKHNILSLSIVPMAVTKFCTFLNTYTCNIDLAYSPAVISPFPVASTQFSLKHCRFHFFFLSSWSDLLY